MTYQYSTMPGGIAYVCEATANVDGTKIRIVKEIAAASMAKAAAEFEEHLDGGIDEKGFEKGFGHHNFTIDITEKGTDKHGGTGYEIKKPCDAPNPESATQTSLPVSDATQLKVGDWVEWCGDQYMIESAPPQSGGRYDIRSPYDELGCSVYPENITRKLSPSEVVVKIGCLSGTVERACDYAYFLMWHSSPKMDCDYSMIRFSAIDTQTRELVESLLKAQEEE